MLARTMSNALRFGVGLVGGMGLMVVVGFTAASDARPRATSGALARRSSAVKRALPRARAEPPSEVTVDDSIGLNLESEATPSAAPSAEVAPSPSPEKISDPSWMQPPRLADWEPTYVRAPTHKIPRHILRPPANFPLIVQARTFNAPIYAQPRALPYPVGHAWWGALIPARRVAANPECGDGDNSGHWLEVPGNGYVCTAADFKASNSLASLQQHHPEPAVWRPSPFTFARVIEDGAPRLARFPSAIEHAALEQAAAPGAGETLDDLVVEWMEGDFFLALEALEQKDGRRYYRSVSGEYVRVDAVEVRPAPEFFGEHVDADSLPLAFVYGSERVPLLCGDSPAADACGAVHKHVRFPLKTEPPLDTSKVVETPDERFVARQHVRIAARIDRPAGVPSGAKWVHIDLSEQTLVAYEDERPVYATLVSTGKAGHETPTGLYRTQRKYVSTTMRGRDPVEGTYHVEQVPWTLYYNGAYAVHAAYWHDDFGKVRSHGCTNLAPADARWLFHWSSLELPTGWHAVLGRPGTYFYFTRD